jgi:hypothetical protein
MYVATLRCQSFHVWPEKTVIEAQSFALELERGHWVRAQLAVLSYLNRTKPAEYPDDESEIGPLVATGRARGLYTVRDSILTAPEDLIEVAWQYAHSRRGEVDISIAFPFPGDLGVSICESLRSTTLAAMAFLNLQLKDHLTPVAPLQISRILESGQRQSEAYFFLSVHNRSNLTFDALQPLVSRLATVLSRPKESPKLKTALELYGSHFKEPQTRTRFLLLVIAMETLAMPRQKHNVVLELAEKWRTELAVIQSKYTEESDEHFALAAFERELLVRTEISIRSQVRELFIRVQQTLGPDIGDLSKRALRVYDQRSKLVHDGSLPESELTDAEDSARELLELAIRSESS